MVNKTPCRPIARHEVYESETNLPDGLASALELFDADHELREVLGPEFCQLYSDIKHAEHDEYKREISPWDRQHLLLNA